VSVPVRFGQLYVLKVAYNMQMAASNQTGFHDWTNAANIIQLTFTENLCKVNDCLTL